MNGLGDVYLDIPILASLLLDGFKYIVRRWVVQDMNFEFDLKLYGILLPLAQLLAAPILVAVGFLDMMPEYIDFSNGTAIMATIGTVLVQAFASVFYYGTVINPVKKEAEYRHLKREIEDITSNVPEDQLEALFTEGADEGDFE